MPTPDEANHAGRKVFSALLGIAACLWFLFVFSRYAPDITARTLPEIGALAADMTRRWGLFDVLLLGWLLVAAYLVGKRFLRWLDAAPDPGIEDAGVSAVVGLMLISWAVLLLGALHLLYRVAAYALLTAPLLVWRRDARQIVSGWRLRPNRAGADGSALAGRIGRGFLIALAAAVLLLVYAAALGPEIEFDPLIMHLHAARRLAQEHRLVAIPEVPQTFLPRSITMLYALGMLLRGDITAKLINYLFGLLTIWVTYSFARKRFSRNTGLTAAAILLSSPLFLWEMKTAHLDLGFTLTVCLSLFATVEWLERGEPRLFRLAVLFTAFSLGTKYQALFSLGSLSALILIYRWIEHRNLIRAMQISVKFFAISLLGMVPWAVVNLVQTGNPVFPLLNGLFGSPYWTPEQAATVLEQMREGGVQITSANWWAVITSFWDMTMGTADFHGNVGPFYLILLPLLLFLRPIPAAVKIILSYSFFYWLFWLFTGQHLRYYLGALPGLAVVCAEAAVGGLAGLWDGYRRAVAVAAAAILAVLAILNAPYFERYGMTARYGYPILDAFPGKYLAGEESRDDYLTRMVQDYPLIQHLNRLPGRKKVLFWWNDPQPAALYLNGKAAFAHSFFVPELYVDDPAQIHSVLRSNGVTHLIAGRVSQDADGATDPERSFVQRYLKRIDAKNAMVLYEVLPEPVAQEITAYDFLAHIERARISMAAAADKPNSDFRLVRSIGEDSRYALVTFPPAEVAFGVTVPARAVLRFAVGRLFPPCDSDGSFQIWIEPAGGERQEIYRRDLRSANPEYPPGWYEEQVDLARYSAQPVQVIFKNEYAGLGDCNWFLWADPAIVVPPESSESAP